MVVKNREQIIDRRSPLRCLVWLIGLAAVALLLAWLSPRIQRHFAPWLIFSLLLGTALGLAAGALAGRLKLSNTRAMIAAVALAAVAIGSGHHLFAWLDYRDRFEQSRQSKPEAALLELSGHDLRPKPFLEFLDFQAQRGRHIGSWQLSQRWTWLSWGVDVAAIVLSAIADFYFLKRAIEESPS